MTHSVTRHRWEGGRPRHESFCSVHVKSGRDDPGGTCDEGISSGNCGDFGGSLRDSVVEDRLVVDRGISIYRHVEVSDRTHSSVGIDRDRYSVIYRRRDRDDDDDRTPK